MQAPEGDTEGTPVQAKRASSSFPRVPRGHPKRLFRRVYPLGGGFSRESFESRFRPLRIYLFNTKAEFFPLEERPLSDKRSAKRLVKAPPQGLCGKNGEGLSPLTLFKVYLTIWHRLQEGL